MFSFDVWNHHLPFIEIYGDAGALTLSDPNEYDGDVLVRGNYEDSWSSAPPELSPSGGTRQSRPAPARDGRRGPRRRRRRRRPATNSGLALHVLEILEAMETASATESVVSIPQPGRRPQSIFQKLLAHA